MLQESAKRRTTKILGTRELCQRKTVRNKDVLELSWAVLSNEHSSILEVFGTKGAIKIETDTMYGSCILYASRLSLLLLTSLYPLFIHANSQLR